MAQDLSTQTGIVNAALARLGSTERLTSIDDPTSNSAGRARAVWGDLRRMLLSRHPFNFAIRRAMLNEDGVVPPFGWQRRFHLPEDCLRWLPPAEGDAGSFDGEREGDFILTNRSAPLPVRYIADMPDVSAWSPSFVMAMTVALAEWLAMGITESVGMTDRLVEIADRAIKLAKRLDGLETGRRQRGSVVVHSSWLTARGRSFHGRYR